MNLHSGSEWGSVQLNHHRFITRHEADAKLSRVKHVITLLGVMLRKPNSQNDTMTKLEDARKWKVFGKHDTYSLLNSGNMLSDCWIESNENKGACEYSNRRKKIIRKADYGKFSNLICWTTRSWTYKIGSTCGISANPVPVHQCDQIVLRE
jgi:hypothetical protein